MRTEIQARSIDLNGEPAGRMQRIDTQHVLEKVQRWRDRYAGATGK